MRIERVPRGARYGDLQIVTEQLERSVREILRGVRDGGDEAVREYTARFDHAELAPDEIRVPHDDIERAAAVLEPEVLAGLRKAIANIRAVAEAQLREPVRVEPGDGQVVELLEVPMRRAAAYVPGGRAPYPSTVVMTAVTARVAGVDQIAVCAPPGPGGGAHPVILGACALCGVTEVYRVGGAQAIAALAYGTESIARVDVIVGPGNAYVTEAKRQVTGVVGIDGLAGPSELAVVATDGADPELIALDLLAQGEHGEASDLYVLSPSTELLDGVVACVEALLPRRPSVADAELRVVETEDVRDAVRQAELLAPEHLQLVGADAEAFAGYVRNAGCLFVGRDAGTAFGDYVAGSNHVLPTGGAARFQSALSPATFRRRMARVSLPAGAAARLAPYGAALARAEGFPVHAESMERRA